MALVYKITNEINGKVYIGFTSRTLHDRWTEHTAHSRTTRTTPLYNAINKYGIEAFKVEEVFTSDIESEALAKECELIAQFNSYNDGGYNATFGGDKTVHTPATIAKISASKVGHTVSKQTREKISSALSKSYLLCSDTSEQIIIHLRKYCKENNLSYTYLIKTLKHSQYRHKGYFLKPYNGDDLLLPGM